MLDLPRLHRIRLTPRPLVQRLVAGGAILPNYALAGVEVVFEHLERLPAHPVVYAMNHTDRYNYFPFQYRLWRKLDRYTATWVKGKYYESRFVGTFMELTNNIPTVSRGYLVTRDFLAVTGRLPTDAQYAALRAMVNAAARGDRLEPTADVPAAVFERPRDMMGRPFEPARQSYAECVDAVFRQMMRRFTELNAEAFDKGLDVIVFPQGTRSKRLSQGHPGLAQIALKYRRTIVPIGCNGSDRIYPSSNPFARGGRVVYRFGEPIGYEDMAPWHVDEDYEPFTPEAELRHGDRFQGLVDHVMDHIEGLVDEEYRYSADHGSGGVQGSSRFV